MTWDDAMFTFGRQKEKECALHYLKDRQQAHLIEAVIDAVHDLLEGKATLDGIRPALSRAFFEGGAGVWEQTGAWLNKLMADHQELESLWTEWASHSELKVRFRTACFLNEIPPALAREISAQLSHDRSKKVRKMTQVRLEELEPRT